MGLYSVRPSTVQVPVSNSPALTQVTVANTSGQLLAANLDRKGFSIYNSGVRDVYLGLGNTVSSSSNYFALIPKESLYEWTLPVIITSPIFAIAAGGNSILQVLELS